MFSIFGSPREQADLSSREITYSLPNLNRHAVNASRSVFTNSYLTLEKRPTTLRRIDHRT